MWGSYKDEVGKLMKRGCGSACEQKDNTSFKIKIMHFNKERGELGSF